MGSAPHIRVLPPHVANKIAAGEVVERPASVLKELLENALDAGATRIEAEVSAGGRKLVAVSDNGPGMTRDDALLSVERQATSKIRDVDDIESISTLGFRGEALAAIASASRFRLTTCDSGELGGTELLIVGGKLQDVRELGRPPGTSVEVRDLFYNIPARRKFLRSYQTESAHIRAGFIEQALAHPAVGMSLKVDGKEVYALAPGASFDDRLRELFGPDCLRNLRPLECRAGEVSVSGRAGTPAVTRSDRNEQYIFINGRATSAPLVSFAIREGYRALLPKDRHPTVFLFIELDPGLVDVNCHPAKKEVRFRGPAAVRDAVILAIRKALAADGAVLPPLADEAPWPDTPIGRPSGAVQMRIEDLPAARPFPYPRMRPEQAGRGAQGAGPAAADPGGPHSAPPASGAATGAAPACEFLPAGTNAPWSWCRVLGLVGNTYVVLETEDGFVLMDPRAAHERVLYERFMRDVARGEVHSQSLLLPETVELQPREAAHARRHVKGLRALGFGIFEFGGDGFVVDALPSHFKEVSARSVMAELCAELEKAGIRGRKERMLEESVAQAASRAAVRARDRLSLRELEQLVTDLAGTEMPYTCPHGRPTLIFTSLRELDKKFGRA